MATSRWSSFSIRQHRNDEVREVAYAVKHSQHIVTRGISAPNESTNQQSLAEQQKRYEQQNNGDNVRVLRF